MRTAAASLWSSTTVAGWSFLEESIEVDGGYRSAAEVTLTASGIPWLRPVD